MSSATFLRAWPLLAYFLVSLGCTDPSSVNPPQPDMGPPVSGPMMDPPFAPVPPDSYVAKVKGLMTGEAVTNDELVAVKADPHALRGLIDTWMATPGFDAQLLTFFRYAFQQGQIDQTSINAQLGGQEFPMTLDFSTALMDSFARTALQLVKDGHPFTETMTTDSYMLTPALLALLAYIDNRHFDDQGQVLDHLLTDDPSWQWTVRYGDPQIPLAQTIDPASPNYMIWTRPGTGTSTTYGATCALFNWLFGYTNLPTDVDCKNSSMFPMGGYISGTDFSTWRMVRIRPPHPGERTTQFFDLPTLRTANEVVLRVPRVGFFSHPAFLANWPTNQANQARVTANQTLIVALGQSFDPAASLIPLRTVAVDSDHVKAGTVCYGCHKLLDPMRQIFRQSLTIGYHEQTDPAQSAQYGVFAFDNVNQEVKSLAALGQTLAGHRLLPGAFAQKLCSYFNSVGCAGDDPEFQRIVQAFISANYDFRVLVREILASPLTTMAADEKTFMEQGARTSIRRRGHLCSSLSARFGLEADWNIDPMIPVPDYFRDPCLQTRYDDVNMTFVVQDLAFGVPSDGYSRGAEAPELASDPDLFLRGSVETICNVQADRLFGGSQRYPALGTPRYSASKPDAAIDDFVKTMMGLPDAHWAAADAHRILTEHFQAAMLMGSPDDALRSTFVLACLSPTNVFSGM